MTAAGKVQHLRQLVKRNDVPVEEHQNNDCPFCIQEIKKTDLDILQGFSTDPTQELFHSTKT